MDTIQRYLDRIEPLRHAATPEAIANEHVKISLKNRKMGSVPSVSLLPVIDCPNCQECRKKCYDVRHDMIMTQTARSRVINSAIYHHDPNRYFYEISGFCRMCTAFRWHVGGDIPDVKYLCGMVQVARENPHCKFLCFTKSFGIVNSYLDTHNQPENLKIIFSKWLLPTIDNRHHLPTCRPIFKNEVIQLNSDNMLCGGNCANCFRADSGCWTLKPDQTIYFPEH